jgi:hypothetical protein
MRPALASGVLLVVSALTPRATSYAQNVSAAFDGEWAVRISCPSNTEETGAKGYNYDFLARVENGYLTGSHGTDGSAASLRIEGPIDANGDALLQARGRTGNPDYAVKKPSSGTPYSYRIKAHFEGPSGSGTRLEARVCNFTFTRK